MHKVDRKSKPYRLFKEYRQAEMVACMLRQNRPGPAYSAHYTNEGFVVMESKGTEFIRFV